MKKYTKIVISQTLILTLLSFTACSSSSKTETQTTPNATTENKHNENTINRNTFFENSIGNNLNNLDDHSTNIANKYLHFNKVIKEYCAKNNLGFTFAQPMEHKISSIIQSEDEKMINLISKLKGSDSISCYTENDTGLNISLEVSIIGTSSNDVTFAPIFCKGSFTSIDKNFKIENSKILEFRNELTEAPLDTEAVNNYISSYYSNSYANDVGFFNEIDQATSELIYIHENVLYYALKYDPKL